MYPYEKIYIYVCVYIYIRIMEAKTESKDWFIFKSLTQFLALEGILLMILYGYMNND